MFILLEEGTWASLSIPVLPPTYWDLGWEIPRAVHFLQFSSSSRWQIMPRIPRNPWKRYYCVQCSGMRWKQCICVFMCAYIFVQREIVSRAGFLSREMQNLCPYFLASLSLLSFARHFHRYPQHLPNQKTVRCPKSGSCGFFWAVHLWTAKKSLCARGLGGLFSSKQIQKSFRASAWVWIVLDDLANPNLRTPFALHVAGHLVRKAPLPSGKRFRRNFLPHSFLLEEMGCWFLRFLGF